MRQVLPILSTLAIIGIAGAPGQVYAQDCTSPEAAIGSVIYNADFDVFQGCTARGWMAWHDLPPDPCDPAENPTPGTACSNGSVYAGLSPDGNEPMYTTPSDAPSTLEWGSSGTTRGTTSVTAGETNTGTLAGFGAAAHPAAHYCASLSAHGADDWYLPAKDELAVLYTNKAAIGSFSDVIYWSSSEVDTIYARLQVFSTGTQSYNFKYNTYSVRCVRK